MLDTKYCFIILFFLNLVLEAEFQQVNNSFHGVDGLSHLYNEQRQCIYRNDAPTSLRDFKLLAGFGCYNYTPSQRLKEGQIRIALSNLNEDAYFLDRSSNIPMLFDYEDENVLKVLPSAFRRHEYFIKWKECAQQAHLCCTHMLEQNKNNSGSQCPMVWDGWSCVNRAEPGTLSSFYCPNIAYSGEPTCQRYATKECFPNGTWNIYTDYLPCSKQSNVNMQEYTYHVIIYLISIAASVPSIIIFNLYYQLQVTRVRLHNNLIISLIVRNVFEILVIYFIIFDQFESDHTSHVMEENGVVCRMLVYFQELAGNWVFASMFLDGFYMYQLIVKTFDNHPPVKTYFLGLAGITLFVTTSWAVMMSQTSNENCWSVPTKNEGLINYGFRFILISCNTVLLFNIMKMLLRKLKTHSNVNHIRTASKATFILVPLFGLQFFLTTYRFKSDSCMFEKIYSYTVSTIIGLQGFIVSSLYCYLNREVQRLLLSSYNELRAKIYISKEARRHKRNHSQENARLQNQNHTEGSFCIMASNPNLLKTLGNGVAHTNNCASQTPEYTLDQNMDEEQICRLQKYSDQALDMFIERKINDVI